MSAPKKRIVNLLVQEGFEYSTAGKALQWLLSAGRTIVVLTELIVIIAFLSRFWLDKTLSDVSTLNAAKKAQIESSLTFETNFKSAQTRLNLVKQFSIDKENASGIIGEITQLLPQDIILTSISVAGNKLSIQGLSLTENSVSSFINSLNNTNKYTNATLSDVTLETKTKQYIKFTLKADIPSIKIQGAKNDGQN